MRFDNLTFQARLTATSKHVGVFPEQLAHWRWMQQVIRNSGRSGLRLLNLFAYTGAASLIAAVEGCEVTHVDQPKASLIGPKKSTPIRLGRCSDPLDCGRCLEIRSTRRAAQSEIRCYCVGPALIWAGSRKRNSGKSEHNLVELLSACRHILSDNPLFILVTMYSIDQSAMLIQNMLQDMMKGYGGYHHCRRISVEAKVFGESAFPLHFRMLDW